MADPILVTGAAGRVGAIGRAVTELLLKQDKTVRAMVRNEDERAQALRDMGAEVVVGNLLDLDSMHRAIAGCATMYFGMSVSDAYLAATVNAAAVAKHHGVKAFINMSQMTLSQMGITETTASPQHKLHWLAEQALNWSALPVVHVRPTVLLEGFFLIFTSDSVRESNQIRLPFGEGKTSPVAVEDVARVLTALLTNPQPHIGKIYHLTGPQSENMNFYAQEYSKALGRTITYQDIPVEPWRDGLLERGLPVHLVNHLATMADLHRAGRYDRMSDDVRTLTGQRPLSVQNFVRKNSATFTASTKAASDEAESSVRTPPNERRIMMSSVDVINKTEAAPEAEPVDMKLEVVLLEVSDVDRAKAFYENLGWRLDIDVAAGDFRGVQMTPHNSEASIIFGKGVTSAKPGSGDSLVLAVDDIDAARDDLIARGVEVSEIFHYASGPFNNTVENPRVGDPQGRSYLSFASFEDPDGNEWLVQEIQTRLPGREWKSARALATDVTTLVELLRETAEQHDRYEKTHAEHHWSDWYAPYLSARQNGSSPEEAAAAADRHMEEFLHSSPMTAGGDHDHRNPVRSIGHILRTRSPSAARCQ